MAVIDAGALTRALEDPVEVRRRRVRQLHLVADASEKRVVGELPRREVRREEDERIEQHFDRLSGVQREVVDATFERADPAIQQRDGRSLLPAEVVDDERATVGLELERAS